ncbi:hypothetical protein N8I77_013760 [Diaporthe amygdali]|uniref:Uncharacterized protein n=1 Tax=Phomopsis amygdali TaxID=1214568 RepID=A0AAD9S1V4_PHOAM|nr:hypothetical protein N8I77_013760 [Diaporthe amygdali]
MQSPRFRWWWPGGWIEPHEVQSEIVAMIDAGFGGAEIGDVEDSIKVQMDPQVSKVMVGHRADGTRVWLLHVNRLTDSPESMKELVHGQIFVQSGQTYTGALPIPVAAPSGNETGNPNVVATPKLAAVLSARANSTNETTSVVTFDPSTVQVITSSVTNNTISWTLLRKIQYRNNGSIFEDSLELKTKQYWTLNFLDEFETRRGYDLSPFLLYVIKDTSSFSGDTEISDKVTNDFYQTVSDLYTEYRLGGLKAWANSIGMRLRVQPYTASFDSTYAASLVDIPEGESLGFEGNIDAFCVLATGRDIGGSTTILSDELGAYMGKAYGVTWKFLLSTANLDMSTGVSQVVIHGFPYSSSPDSRWPGFAAFTPLGTNSNGFADAWGPLDVRHQCQPLPSQRAESTPRRCPSIDVAILNDAWGIDGEWPDDSLNAAGFSYQFPTPELLIRHSITVDDARLAPLGPNYKAMVVNNPAMDASVAELLLDYAQDGLPLVLVEPLPNATFSYSNDTAAQLKRLNELLSEISKLSTTTLVSDKTAVPSALSSLGVRPSVRYSTRENASLITYRRTMGSGFLYWVYNNGDDVFDGNFELEGQGYPLSINLWSGSVNPLAAFASSEGYVSVNSTIQPTFVAVFYLGPDNDFGASLPINPLVATNCDNYVRDGTVYISSRSKCSASTSNGTHITLSPSSLPSSISPSNWTLSVQDWRPAQVNETGLDSPDTVKENLDPITLTELFAWPNITGLTNASGIGKYATTISLTKGNSPATRVLLEVGQVEGTWGVRLNGQVLTAVDWFGNKPIDVTDLVLDGANYLEIIVATTLWNKLRAVWPELYGSLEAQLIGLIGPVNFSYSLEEAL